MKLALAAGLVAASALAWTTSARADDVDAQLRGYYGGERLSAYLVGGTGAAAAGAGAYLVTRDASFDRGLGVAWLAMGSLETIGAVVYAIQVGGEIRHYESALARDPGAYRAEELDHLHGTSSRFVIYRAVELSLALAGAGTAIAGAARRQPQWVGAGVGVGSLALPFFVLDTVNDARASRYLDEVKRYQPTVGVAPGDAQRPWMLSLSGRF